MKVNLKPYNGMWKNQPCFIVGGGYSLNDFDFDLLQGKNVIAVNRSFERCYFADFFFTIDHRFLTWLENGTLGHEALEVFKQFGGKKFYLNTANHHDLKFDDIIEIPYLQGYPPCTEVGFSDDLEKGLYSMSNSGGGALQLAVALGANPIYLLGFDMNKKRDKTHHHAEYPEPTKVRKFQGYIRNLEIYSEMLKKKNIKVININNPESCGIQCFEFARAEVEKIPWIVVTFYTKGTEYETDAKRLIESLEKFGIKYHAVGVYQDLGSREDWKINTHYKPKFISKMMRKFKDFNIVWIDADGEVMSYPKLFDSISCDIGVHYRDGHELLTGTIFLKNSVKTRRIVRKWAKLSEKERTMPKSEQLNFQRVIDEEGGIEVLDLPSSYTKIYDTMNGDAVIKHYQASRRYRKL